MKHDARDLVLDAVDFALDLWDVVRLAFAILAVAVLIAGCGGECRRGSERPCLCGSVATGTEFCDASETWGGACVCPEPCTPIGARRVCPTTNRFLPPRSQSCMASRVPGTFVWSACTAD